MGFLTKQDSTLFRGFFKEMAHLRGITVEYLSIEENETTVHGEILPKKFREPVMLDVIFDENPSVKTLRKIGWVSISPDDKPYLMQLPFDTPHLTAEARVRIPPIDSVGSARTFRITNITTLLEFPDCYTCTVVPVPDSEKPKNLYTTGYNYIENDPPKRRKGKEGYSYIKPGE